MGKIKIKKQQRYTVKETNKLIKVGSIIKDTMQMMVIVEAFEKELMRIGLNCDQEKLRSRKIDKYDLLHYLVNILNDHAPEGLYFGSHPENFTNFGWWGLAEREAHQKKKKEERKKK